MFERFIELARRIRHVLDAWFLLVAVLVLGGLPWIGLPLGVLCAAAGGGAALRVIRDGGFIHGILLGVGFLLLLASIVAVHLLGFSETLPSRQVAHPQLQVTPLRFYEPVPERNPVRSVPSDQLARSSAPVPTTKPDTPTPGGLILGLVPHAGSEPEFTILTNPNTAKAMPSGDGTIAVLSKAEIREFVTKWWRVVRTRNVDGELLFWTDPAVVNGTNRMGAKLKLELASAWRQSLHDSEIGCLDVVSDGEKWNVEIQSKFEYGRQPGESPGRGQCYFRLVIRDVGARLRISEYTDKVVPTVASNEPINRMYPFLLRALSTSCIEADLEGVVGESIRFYAPSVDYFGSKRDLPSVRADKLSYMQRWPKREEWFEGEFRVTPLPQDRVEAVFRGRFRTESDERGEWCAGIVEHHFVFALVDGHPLIVGESAKTIESRKGKL